MNREIKFRAWDKGRQEMLEDVRLSGMLNRKFQCENLIFLQYNGLKDKNGVEIYEGDIVNGWTHNPREQHVVKYISDKYNCGFMASSVSGYGKIHVWYDGLKVIGNIYENPELINGVR